MYFLNIFFCFVKLYFSHDHTEKLDTYSLFYRKVLKMFKYFEKLIFKVNNIYKLWEFFPRNNALK